MSYSNYPSRNQQDRAMSEEQFNQVIDAILSGKYSWACVLILRFAGYNPLHYIPYRTYNRLIKEHDRRDENNNTRSCQCDRIRQKVS
ncbi:MAG: HetP family heterocyst commitment protein [Lyngbya sp.]|nr:HetP family heterocyst commitment protein [Lyngbya sp.]